MKHVSLKTAWLLAWVGLAGCANQPVSDTHSIGGDAAFQRGAAAYLASDALEGRGLGTRGQILAGEYIADVFRKSGLQPGGVDGTYFQPFEYTAGMTVGPGTTLTIGKQRVLPDTGFRLNSATARDKNVADAELVFAGYGITSTEYGWDDYADIDVKGKVVLVMRFEPRNADGRSLFTGSQELSAEAAITRKVSAAFANGAVGVVLVNPERELGGEDVLSVFSGRGSTRNSALPVMQVSRAALDKVLGAGRFKKLSERVISSAKPASEALGVSVSMSVDLRPKVVVARNVIGYLPGRKTDEFVVAGAHYDHLGLGGSGSLAGSVNAVHHGADDNASGTTVMMTLARRLGASVQRGEIPGRSVLFMAFSCEELGLIGSDHWTEHPTVPIEQVKYMLNMDMVGRMKNNVLSHGGEGTAAVFDEILAKAYEGLRVGRRPVVRKSIGKGGYGPSDHQSFAAKRIPVIFLFTGLHADYHRPSDTADKLNYSGMMAATEVADRVLRSMIAAPVSPYDASHDGDAVNLAATAEPTTRQLQRGSPDAVGLGLVPDMNVSDRGMKIDGVREGGAAANAGIKSGDLLLELAGTTVNSVEDLQAVYDLHKPGDKVKAVVERDGKQIEVEVTFTRRAQRN